MSSRNLNTIYSSKNVYSIFFFSLSLFSMAETGGGECRVLQVILHKAKIEKTNNTV
jgi:hypothetical protein